MDELISFTLVTDPSFTHALSALAHGADGGFPSYYFVAWPVAHYFGHGEFTIRVVSSVFMALAFGILFRLLKNRYGIVPAMLSTTMSIGGSTLILYQNSELRFYADLFFSTAVAVCGFEFLYWCVEQNSRRFQAMAVNAFGHTLLVLSHPFGIAYSLAISAAALLVSFWLGKRNFFVLYAASAGAGCAMFFFWLPGFLQQTHIIAGHGHVPVPSLADLARVYTQLVPLIYYNDGFKNWAAIHFLPVRQHVATLAGAAGVAVAMLALVVFIVRWLISDQSKPLNGIERDRLRGEGVEFGDRHLWILAATFVLVPAGVWVISHLGTSLFVHRYFIPTVLGFSIVYAHMFARAGYWITANGWWSTTSKRAAGIVAVLFFALLYVAWPLAAAVSTPDGHAEVFARIASQDRGLPVLSYPTNFFWQSSHYAPTNHYWFLLDEEVAHDPRNSPTAAAEFSFSSVLKEYYPDLHIRPSEVFLRDNPEFILEIPVDSLWFRIRLVNNHEFAVKPDATLPPNELRMARTGSH